MFQVILSMEYLEINFQTRPHLLEHPMANKQPDEPKDDKNNFSFNHFEMIRMQKVKFIIYLGI